MKSKKELNLYQKLLEIQKQIVGLGEDKKSFGYKYVSGSKVLSHVKPLMNEYGILLKQEVLDIENSRQDYSLKNGTLKSEVLTKARMKFTWIDVDSGETDENLFAANGQNDWEKGLGSALTYAERYFLLKYFHISTDKDDIDNPERKEDNKEVKKPSSKPKQKTATEEDKKQKLIKAFSDSKEKTISSMKSKGQKLSRAQANILVSEKIVTKEEIADVVK